MNKQDARKIERALAADADAIKTLAHDGSDLSLAHTLTFSFLFKSQDAAAAARTELATLGFAASEPQKPPHQPGWRVSAEKRLVPAPVGVHHLTMELLALAGRHHGQYDGWTAPVTRST